MVSDATMSLSVVCGALQLAIGLTFAVACFEKVRSPGAFTEIVRGYRLVPERMAVPTAGLVLIAEAYVAITCLTGFLISSGIPIALTLLSLFFGAVGWNLHKGRTIACGCFGKEAERISRRHLVRLALLFGAGAGVLIGQQLGSIPFGTEAFRRHATDQVAYAVFAASLTMFFLTIATWITNLGYVRVALLDSARKPLVSTRSREG